VAAAALFAAVCIQLAPSASAAAAPPPAGGYFTGMQGVGSFSSLPSESQAASMVHRSTWEPRPENYTANHTVPSAGFVTAGYSGMENHAQLFGRVTGNFTGTTDEIIQWAAAKWGLPDDVIRAAAVAESSWYQNLKDSSGRPVATRGYGDYGDCGGSPAPSGYGSGGPSSFGLMQIKWCAHKDASAPGYGTWPSSERATAYNLDYFGAIIRGCFEGWDAWLGNGYKSGDMWGCIGRWYAGEWYSAGANNYIATVKNIYDAKPWRTWTDAGSPSTSPSPPPAPDSTPPAAPGNLLAAVRTSSQIDLTWSASTDNVGVIGYDVYSNGVKLATTESTNYSANGLSANTSYSFYVVAWDAANNVSPNSNAVTATTRSASNADTIAPTLTINSPDDGARVWRSVRINATATDNTEVVKMELYIDGSLERVAMSGDISYGWKSKWASLGLHVITIKAFDAAGNVGTQSRSVYR
jgi:hypothetical protein